MENKSRRIRRFYIRGIIGFTFLAIIGFILIKSEDNTVAVAIKKEVPKTLSTADHAPLPKRKIDGSTLAESIIQKEKEETDQKIVYLTFDDGPSADASELLDTLNRYEAKATFFMLAPNMIKHPDIVKQIVKDGFGVGLHGVTHDASQFYQSKESALHEMQEAQAVLEQVTGIKSTLVRTPYGSVPYLLDSYRTEMESFGFQIWDWNIDSEDWVAKGDTFVSHVINRIQRLERAGEHPIILMHDRGPTIKYLPDLLKWLNDNHYVTKNLEDNMEAFSFKCNGRCSPFGSN